MSKHKKSRDRTVDDTAQTAVRTVPMTVTSPNDAVPVLAGSELLAPATIEPLFWQPRLLTDSPVLVHVPFLFWLCNVVQPRTIVTLGVGDGAGHFALCQALDKLNIAGRCEGHGVWPGPDPVPAPLLAHEAQFYADLSVLGGNHADGLRPGSVDLLFVDLTQSGDHDPHHGEWFTWLKPDGILILHGTAQSGDGDVFANQLAGYRRVEFRNGNGLTILTQASNLPHRLQTLLDICEDGMVPGDIDRIFRRLGQGLVLLAREQQSETALNDARAALAAEKAAHQQSDEHLADTRAAYDQRCNNMADLQTRLFDAEQAHIREREQSLIQQQEQARILEQEKISSAAESDSLRNRIDTLTRQIDALRNDYKERLAAAQPAHRQETEILNRRIAEILPAQAQQSDEITKLRQKLASLQARNKKMDRHIKDLLNSTSWRITAPIRKIRTALKR